MRSALRHAALVGVLSLGLTASAQDDARQWSINIQEGTIQQLAENVAMITGKTITLDPRVKANVTVISEAQLTKDEVYELFQNILRVHGFGTVEVDDMVSVVTTPTLKSWADDNEMNLSGASPDEFVTQVILLKHIKSTEITKVLRQIVPQFGHLATTERPNAVVIVDYAGNMERNLRLIRELDVLDNYETIVFQLKNSYVVDVVNILQQVLPSDMDIGSITAVANERNNSLVLRGSTEGLAAATDIVTRLDASEISADSSVVLPLKHSKAGPIAELINDLLAPGAQAATQLKLNKVVAQEELNAVVARGDPTFIGEVRSLVDQLDINKPQVLIEAAIIEVTIQEEDKLGTELAAIDETGSRTPLATTTVAGLLTGILKQLSEFQGDSDDSDSGASPGAAVLGSVTSPTLGVAKLDADGVSFGAIIGALTTFARSDLLSTPHVIGADNTEAEIFVGLNVPQRQGSFGFNQDTALDRFPVSQIGREDVGIKITVTPHVGANLAVRMDIKSKVDTVVDHEIGVGDTGFSDVVTSVRRIETTVTAQNRQTIVLGGLIQDDIVETVSGVPGLRRIPLLGRLFRSETTKNAKRHLLVFLRPTVLESDADIEAETNRKYSGIWQIQIDADESAQPPQMDDLYEGRP